MSSVGIVGGGILGSWTAYTLRDRGFSVTLFEKEVDLDASRAASFAAGGLLCPFSELESSEPLVASLGLTSLSLWSEFHQRARNFYFRREGTLVLAHPSDRGELTRLTNRLAHTGFSEMGQSVDKASIRDLEPGLETSISSGLFFPQEGQLDPRAAWKALRGALIELGVGLENGEVTAIAPGRLDCSEKSFTFDWVIDCRGLGAKVDLPQLRGVRGERLTLQSNEVILNRAIRLMHPTTPLYLAPLENKRFIVGATMLESESEQNITVRSLVELSSAAFSLDSRFAEAEILETVVGHRPAFPDNLPRIEIQKGLVRINGLYRHGYLASPALALEVTNYLLDNATQLFSKGALCKFA